MVATALLVRRLKSTIASILATVDDVTRREEQPHTQSEVPAGAQMWMRLSNRIYDYLDSITLEEAIEASTSDAETSAVWIRIPADSGVNKHSKIYQENR